MKAPTTARNRFVADGMGSTPPGKLLVLLYDRLLRDVDEAAVAIDRRDTVAAHEALTHAQDIVAELHSALDVDRWDGASAMVDIYTFLADLLARANIAKSLPLVVEARSVIAPLRDTWAEAYVAATESAAPARVAGGVDVAG
jgi:flagellar secretion chaperone FliS